VRAPVAPKPQGHVVAAIRDANLCESSLCRLDVDLGGVEIAVVIKGGFLRRVLSPVRPPVAPIGTGLVQPLAAGADTGLIRHEARQPALVLGPDVRQVAAVGDRVVVLCHALLEPPLRVLGLERLREEVLVVHAARDVLRLDAVAGDVRDRARVGPLEVEARREGGIGLARLLGGLVLAVVEEDGAVPPRERQRNETGVPGRAAANAPRARLADRAVLERALGIHALVDGDRPVVRS
jgi:hypothetical protein